MIDLHRRALLGRGGLVALALAADPRRLVRPAAAADPPDERVWAVGTRTGYATQGYSDGSKRWIATRLTHVMPASARDLQLVYANVAPAHGAEIPGENPIRVSAAIEYPAGRISSLSFAGQPFIDLAGGAIAVSDPLALTIPATAIYYTRTSVIAQEAPYKWPQNRIITPEIGDWVATGLDPKDMPGSPEQVNKQGFCLGPYNILGKLDRPHVAVVILGDSVVAGGHGDYIGNRSYVERALGDHVAWCNMALAGDSVDAFLHRSETRRQLIGHNFTHVITALGIADVRGGNEAATRANLLELWKQLAAMGLRVFQTTITTHTKSTDHWTTTEGQSVANPNFLPGGMRVRINEWIRSVPAPLEGYFDAAAFTETAPDSGIWVAPAHQPITVDGPHLNVLGSELAAHCIDVTKLRLGPVK
jgi:hypothetical protein